MPLDLTKIEEFFGTTFLSEPESEPAELSMNVLFHFDGDTHWFIGVCEAKQQIWLTSNNEFGISSFPSLELNVNYSNHDARLTPNWDGGKVLIIHPRGCKTRGNLLVLTKNAKGKISLSTMLGELPEDQRDTLAQEWFPDPE